MVHPLHPTYNLHMFRARPREEDPKVNVMLKSGTMTSEDKGKQPIEGEFIEKSLGKETRA